jgi:rhamnose utilization protein RhaD (predicted bifunctional aldolase and dehydrogenase)
LLLENRWDDAVAAAMTPAELLLYRSNLLGSDQRITNFGGGNTSAKLPGQDPLTGKDVRVLWVKGSGGDLGTMKLDGFATLYMDKFLVRSGDSILGCRHRRNPFRTLCWQRRTAQRFREA